MPDDLRSADLVQTVVDANCIDPVLDFAVVSLLSWSFQAKGFLFVGEFQGGRHASNQPGRVGVDDGAPD